MNIRHSLLAFALVSAAACFTPSAFAQDQDQSTTQPAPEPQEEHQGVRQDAHEVGQAIRQDAHEVGDATRDEAHEIHQSMHRTAHWRRYHVCRRYWHHHCVRWSRRYPH